jgi:hypothetical protein
VREVYVDGQGVAGHGDKKVCPPAGATTRYSLHVVKVDGSTADEEIAVEVASGSGDSDPPAPPGGGSWGQVTADLEAIEIFIHGDGDDGAAMVKIKNNGPDNLTSDQISAVCYVTYYVYCSEQIMVQGSESWSPTGGMSAGSTGEYFTGIDVDTSQYRVEVECTVSTEVADPNPGNNTVEQSFATKRCL